MTGELISTAPLDEGDPIGMDTWANEPRALGGQPGDIVAISVPCGKGLIFEMWLRRQLFGGDGSTRP
jgi:hypothetical protein